MKPPFKKISERTELLRFERLTFPPILRRSLRENRWTSELLVQLFAKVMNALRNRSAVDQLKNNRADLPSR
jgi:hypothetical protein